MVAIRRTRPPIVKHGVRRGSVEWGSRGEEVWNGGVKWRLSRWVGDDTKYTERCSKEKEGQNYWIVKNF